MKKIPKLIFIISIIVLVAGAGVGVWYWWQHQKTNQGPTNQSAIDGISQGYNGAIQPEPDDPQNNHFNVVYDKANNLKLDLYIPEAGKAPYPVIIYAHGGGWFTGDKRSLDSKTWVTDLAENGFAVASVNYRLAPDNIYPTAIEDIEAAYQFLQSNADEYQLDIAKVGSLGTSAGGQISSLWAFKKNEAASQKIIKAAILLWTPSDLTDPAIPEETRGYINDFLGDPSQAAEASPVNHITKYSPPSLLAHGDKDNVVPYEQSVRFVEKLKGAGVKSRLIQVLNGVHYFVESSAQIRPTRNQLQKQMVDFYRTYLYK